MNGTNRKVKAFRGLVTGLFLSGALFARGAVVYVTPELPAGSDESGSSWANAMTNLTAACAAATTSAGHLVSRSRTGVQTSRTGHGASSGRPAPFSLASES